MSDVPPAGENVRSALPRCARVALAAVGPPDEAGSVWTDVIPLGDDRVGLVIGETGHHPLPMVQLRRLVAEALGGGRSPVRALEALDRYHRRATRVRRWTVPRSAPCLTVPPAHCSGLGPVRARRGSSARTAGGS